MMNGTTDNQTRKSKKKNDMLLGTWDIRTLMQIGKTNEVALKLNKLRFDIVALQELRWKDAGILQQRDFALYYSGAPEKSG